MQEMFEKVAIQGYRKFPTLKIEPLGRVNLFVGKNNCGKSSVLEALELLSSSGPQTLLNICERRGEFPFGERRDPRLGPIVNVSGLFNFIGENGEGVFNLTGCGNKSQNLTVKLAYYEEQRSIIILEEGEEIERADSSLGLFLDMASAGVTEWHRKLRLDEEGSVSLRTFNQRNSENVQSTYVGTQRSEPRILSRLWDDVVLAGREDLVLECLRIVNPHISKLHFTRQAYERGSGGIAIIEKGRQRPVPLGSLGDGAKHLLTLSIHLADVQGGVLLIDEIDTGLHYSILRQVWKILLHASEELGIQVFATTHSWDCIRALAQAVEKAAPTGDVFLHRIEGHETVSYDSSSIKLVTLEDVEVR